MTNPESKAAAILGRKGGLSRSEAKVRAAKENGKKGGAPKKTDYALCPKCDYVNGIDCEEHKNG